MGAAAWDAVGSGVLYGTNFCALALEVPVALVQEAAVGLQLQAALMRPLRVSMVYLHEDARQRSVESQGILMAVPAH